jgi:hypothetical protein
MQSRLLQTLLAQAQSAPDRVDWARAVCRAASHMARSGQLDHALSSITAVRAQFGPGLHPEVASWLMLSEGILHFCRFENTAAYDRMQRAYGLAVAFKSVIAIPSCAAWMALIEFNTMRREKMVKHLLEAISLAHENDHQALSRASLVVACAYHLGGDFNTARSWYERARRHATAEGDEATLGALFFNVASFRMNDVRLMDAFDEKADGETRRAFIEAAGSFSYDYMTGNSAQEPWRLLLRGQHLTVEKKFSEAKKILDQVDAENVDSTKTAPIVLADRAWCAVNIFENETALELANEALQRVDSASEPDDRAYIFARVSQVYGTLNLTDKASATKKLALTNFAAYKEFQVDLLRILQPLSN